jgi:hypothetical protein
MEYGISSQEFYSDFEDEAFRRGFDAAHAESENVPVIDPEDNIPY